MAAVTAANMTQILPSLHLLALATLPVVAVMQGCRQPDCHTELQLPSTPAGACAPTFPSCLSQVQEAWQLQL